MEQKNKNENNSANRAIRWIEDHPNLDYPQQCRSCQSSKTECCNSQLPKKKKGALVRPQFSNRESIYNSMALNHRSTMYKAINIDQDPRLEIKKCYHFDTS